MGKFKKLVSGGGIACPGDSIVILDPCFTTNYIRSQRNQSDGDIAGITTPPNITIEKLQAGFWMLWAIYEPSGCDGSTNDLDFSNDSDLVGSEGVNTREQNENPNKIPPSCCLNEIVLINDPHGLPSELTTAEYLASLKWENIPDNSKLINPGSSLNGDHVQEDEDQVGSLLQTPSNLIGIFTLDSIANVRNKKIDVLNEWYSNISYTTSTSPLGFALSDFIDAPIGVTAYCPFLKNIQFLRKKGTKGSSVVLDEQENCTETDLNIHGIRLFLR